MLRKGLLLLAVTVLVPGLLPASPAAAAYGWLINEGRVTGTGIHLQPANTSSVLSMISPGRPVTDFCRVQGQRLNGNSSWDLVFHSGFNVAGFTNNWYLTRQDQTLDCADRTGMLTVYATIWSDNPPGTTAMHSCPDNACPALVFLPQGRYSRYGDPIEICYTEGASLGQMSNQWSLLYHRGHVGWTHRHWLAHSVNGTDHC